MPLRRTLTAAALAVLALACSSTGDPAADRGLPAAVGSALAGNPTPGGPGDGTPDATTAGGADTGGATGSAPAATEPRVVAARARPPAAGTYRYSQEGVSLFGPMPDEGTLVIGAVDARGRQTHTRTVSDNEVTEQRLRFTDGGVLLLAVSQTFGSGAFAEPYECRFEPALIVIELPMTLGDRIDARSSCGDLTIEYSARVLRTENRTIGGRTVETVVLRATITATDDGVSQTTTSTSWLSPVYRLVVRSEQRSEGTYEGVRFHTSLTEELLDLRPR
ncbi:MAG TPA: hypothetical protein VGB52_05010 [Actinomycetota bacterium]